MSHAPERILKNLLALPTAPFAEHHVIEAVRAFCAERKPLRFTQDRAANVMIRLGRARRRPLVLAAHLDHPGFVAEEMVGPRRLRACWQGGVRPEYFRDARVRFFANGRWIRGRVLKYALREGDGPRSRFARVREAEIHVSRPVAPGAIGMWDFPDPRVRGRRIHARGCDDVAGAAAALACLDGLVQQGRDANVRVLLTRAEEDGFIGAIAACRHRTIPKDAVVVAIECSAERPHAKMGDGPILRVGDATAVFTPGATAWCRAVADQLAARDRTFHYQRKLMDGGTCESAVYCEFGYDATGVCVALGNYHNMNARRGRLGAEYVDLRDWRQMVQWFVALATTDVRYDRRHPGLRQRLEQLEQRHRRQLGATARTAGKRA
jgi:putative aminopeptidase FrvX